MLMLKYFQLQLGRLFKITGDGPAEGERPTGYIIILHDKETANSAGCNHGIAAQKYCSWGCRIGIRCMYDWLN